ncbi:hypothetical protein FOZ62_024838, partial [Perkinsus olseni]
MDDLVRPCHAHADLQVCDETITVYATHQFHLTNDRLCSDHSVTALGLDVSLDFIIYRRDKYDAVCQIEIPTDASFRKGLEVLGLIVNEPDFLGLHILPVKHALVGLLSHWRHVNQSKWDEPMPIPLLDLIRDWVDLVKSTPLPKVPRSPVRAVRAALSILLNRRVARGPHQALYQKFLDLIQVASANFHIRSELLYEVHRVRSDLVDKLLPAEDPKT